MSLLQEPSKVSSEDVNPKCQRVPSMKLPVSQFQKAYQSAEEVQRAKKNGTFDINRTMVMRNGRLFFLCTT